MGKKKKIMMKGWKKYANHPIYRATHNPAEEVVEEKKEVPAPKATPSVAPKLPAKKESPLASAIPAPPRPDRSWVRKTKKKTSSQDKDSK
tara:strand:- start:359 stop:628 length:270 start_codon:yes stop_codon:yes gene_type:complete